MQLTMLARAVRPGGYRLVAVAAGGLLSGCATVQQQTLVTIADARSERAVQVDVGTPGDTPGDLVVFDQPLLAVDGDVIGRNSGFCVRTRVAQSYQCQWTLSLANGTIQVAGHEFDEGASSISIVGGTGDYAHISGEMVSVNNNDGTFTQTLRFRTR